MSENVVYVSIPLSFSVEIYIMAFAFATLAACVFLKNLLIYIAVACAWLAVIFVPGTSFPDYVRLAAVAVVFFSVMSIYKMRRRSEV